MLEVGGEAEEVHSDVSLLAVRRVAPEGQGGGFPSRKGGEGVAREDVAAEQLAGGLLDAVEGHKGLHVLLRSDMKGCWWAQAAGGGRAERVEIIL